MSQENKIEPTHALELNTTEENAMIKVCAPIQILILIMISEVTCFLIKSQDRMVVSKVSPEVKLFS